MLSSSTPSLRLGFSVSDFIFILPRVPPLTRLQRVYHMPPRMRGAQKFRSLTRAICPLNYDLVFMFLMMPTRLQFIDVAAR